MILDALPTSDSSCRGDGTGQVSQNCRLGEEEYMEYQFGDLTKKIPY
jgi:hypothetical protein